MPWVKAGPPASLPDADIYLRIGGEPAMVPGNTWIGIFDPVHAYPDVAGASVLDDRLSDQAAAMSGSFGRPILEVFYRVVRVPRDRFSAALGAGPERGMRAAGGCGHRGL